MVGKNIKGILNFVAWLTGVIVALAVGFAMVGPNPTLTIPWIPEIVTIVAGWIVVVTTVLSAVLAILKQ